MTVRNVQGLRGVAVLLVLVSHLGDFSNHLHASTVFDFIAPLGESGVDLFL